MRVVLGLIMMWLTAMAGQAAAETASDPTELRRTYANAVVYVPNPGGTPQRISVEALPDYLRGQPSPRVVLYAHGCAGISRIDHTAGRFYSGQGYVFVAPNGFARATKPVSCRPLRQQGGLHRAVLAWRHAELDHALRRLRALPGLARAPLALVGHSEGGITVATIRTMAVSARIIEGWTCHGGWPEYKGLNAPHREPVLALVGKNDPWFQAPELKGDCGPFMDGNDQSVVYTRPSPLHNNHWLSWSKRVRPVILRFLARHM